MDPRTRSPHEHPEARHWAASPWMVACTMLALIVLFFVLREHWDHMAGKWLYLLLLACPLMHLFMHGGHGHANHHQSTGGDPRERRP